MNPRAHGSANPLHDEKVVPDERPNRGSPDAHADSKPADKDDLKTLPLAEVEKRLESSPDGLTQAEAEKRLARYGPNEIEEMKGNPFVCRECGGGS